MKNIRRVHQKAWLTKAAGYKFPARMSGEIRKRQIDSRSGTRRAFPAVLHSQRDTVRSRDRILKKRKVRRREGEHREQHADQAEQRKSEIRQAALHVSLF